MLTLLRGEGRPVAVHVVDDQRLLLGVNDRVDLARVREIARRQILEGHMRAGVDVIDPGSTVIDAGVVLGEDTVVEPLTVLRGARVPAPAAGSGRARR